jgi:hypothetical protein
VGLVTGASRQTRSDASSDSGPGSLTAMASEGSEATNSSQGVPVHSPHVVTCHWKGKAQSVSHVTAGDSQTSSQNLDIAEAGCGTRRQSAALASLARAGPLFSPAGAAPDDAPPPQQLLHLTLRGRRQRLEAHVALPRHELRVQGRVLLAPRAPLRSSDRLQGDPARVAGLPSRGPRSNGPGRAGSCPRTRPPTGTCHRASSAALHRARRAS